MYSQAFHQFDNGQWAHRPWWKVAINKVLRTIQPRSNAPFLITSVCQMHEGRPIKCTGYNFRRMPQREKWTMNQDYELTKGVALVLVGPEGCGKTTLAYEIAQRYGKVRSISGYDLHDGRIRSALQDRPDVLIVNEMADNKAVDTVKGLLTSGAIYCMMEVSITGVRRLKAPTYIICTGSPNALHISRDDRRFRVVDVGAQARGRDEIEAENAELRELLTAAYHELQRHGVKSVALGPYSLTVDPPEPVHRGTSPTDWHCRCAVKFRQMIADVGICPDCGEAPVMDDEGPFSHCRCGTQEDYGKRPLQAMQLELRRATHEAAPISQAAWASLDPKEYTPVHNAVLRFLKGTGPYNGLWFHETESGASPYWWRKYLPKPEGGEDE